MPLYDTSLVNKMNGTLNSKGKPMRFVDYNTLCKIFNIHTPMFPREKQFFSPTVQPLQEVQVRKYAFHVEHLMTIMQEQIADKNEDEIQEVIMMIGKQYINQIKSMVKTEKKNTVSKPKGNNTVVTDDSITMIVETEICKQIIQVFIVFKS